MTKSPLAKGSQKAKSIRNSKNVVPLHFTIHYKRKNDKNTRKFDVSHLLHFRADKNNNKIENRTSYLRSFCKKAKEYVHNGNSAKSTTGIYETFYPYIKFCDSVDVDPFSETGYLKYAGNNGELRHRIKLYTPSKKLWERRHGDELGIKESTAGAILTTLRKALSWCGLPTNIWQTQHKCLAGESTPIKGYSDA